MSTAENITVKRGNISITMPANDVMSMMLQEINRHPDDEAVNNFAAAMRAKMKFAREVKGRQGWNDPQQCSKEHLHQLLLQQLISKGDAVDLANFAMMLHQRNEPIDIRLAKNFLHISNSETPSIGTMWAEEGGIYAGMIRGDNQDHHLIISPDELGEIKEVEWGCKNNEITGASSLTDGMANTQAMAENGSELAKRILGLEIDGHKDWYLPARKEARLCYVNCQDQFDHDPWYWTSTQCSAGYAYVQDFVGGTQSSDHKSSRSRARAVRRKLII